jgi:transcription factor SOX7/8/10/18 (SOX group E/F)
MYGQGYGHPQGQQWSGQPAQAAPVDPTGLDPDDTDRSHRPPNAFILYSQAMRSAARQDNPALSNTEVSRILGKMWKEVPNDVKQQYKQRAAKLQEEFKREHPDYTYRKARRKRALNELLTKSTQGAAPIMYPQGDPQTMAMYQQALQYGQFAGQAPGLFPGMQQMGIPPTIPQTMPQMQAFQQQGMLFGMPQYQKPK